VLLETVEGRYIVVILEVPQRAENIDDRDRVRREQDGNGRLDRQWGW
jgi:hypothetical protein